MMQKIIQRSEERGANKLDWLDSKFSFSFSNYYNPDRMHFGALRVLNDDIIAPMKGFGMHPHDNMEIISVPISGQLAHKDSTGVEETITADEIQVMSAGSGLLHSEYNNSENEDAHFLQIWIDTKKRNTPAHHAKAKVTPGSNSFSVVVSGIDTSAPLHINQDASLALGKIESAKKATYTVTAGNGLFVFVIDGSITVAGETLEKRDSIELEQVDLITIEAKKDAYVLLIDVPMNK